MAIEPKSNRLMGKTWRSVDLTGKSLEEVSNVLGNYSKMENLETENAILYTWELKKRSIKLKFNEKGTCIKTIEEIRIKSNWLMDLRTPIIMTLFAGFVGIGVGYTWEYFKFKRQTVFEKRIDLILDSRKQVQDLFIEYDRLFRQIRSYEKEYKRQNICDPRNFSNQIEELKLLGLRVRYIKEFSKGVIHNPELNTYIDAFEKENVEYINCLSQNMDCEICTNKFPNILNHINKIIELHTNEINSQIQ